MDTDRSAAVPVEDDPDAESIGREAPKSTQREVGGSTSQRDPEVMYHSSAAQNRRSIQERGLLIEYDQGQGLTWPGVYLSPDPSPREWDDVWEIDVRGLSLRPDDPAQAQEFQDVGARTSWRQTFLLTGCACTALRPRCSPGSPNVIPRTPKRALGRQSA